MKLSNYTLCERQNIPNFFLELQGTDSTAKNVKWKSTDKMLPLANIYWPLWLIQKILFGSYNDGL